MKIQIGLVIIVGGIGQGGKTWFHAFALVQRMENDGQLIKSPFLNDRSGAVEFSDQQDQERIAGIGGMSTAEGSPTYPGMPIDIVPGIFISKFINSH